MKIKDLIELGGGFRDTTYWKSIYKKSGELVRRDPDSRYEKVININLNKVLIDDNPHNLELQNKLFMDAIANWEKNNGKKSIEDPIYKETKK